MSLDFSLAVRQQLHLRRSSPPPHNAYYQPGLSGNNIQAIHQQIQAVEGAVLYKMSCLSLERTPPRYALHAAQQSACLWPDQAPILSLTRIEPQECGKMARTGLPGVLQE